MEILLWLLPAVVATLASMAWVAWLGRSGRDGRAIDREESARRLGAALARAEKRAPIASAARIPERGTGVALRASRPRPTVIVGSASDDDVVEVVEDVIEEVRIVRADASDDHSADGRDRRAS